MGTAREASPAGSREELGGRGAGRGGGGAVRRGETAAEGGGEGREARAEVTEARARGWMESVASAQPHSVVLPRPSDSPTTASRAAWAGEKGRPPEGEGEGVSAGEIRPFPRSLPHLHPRHSF